MKTNCRTMPIRQKACAPGRSRPRRSTSRTMTVAASQNGRSTSQSSVMKPLPTSQSVA